MEPGVDTALIFMCLFSEHTNLSSQRIENRNFTDLMMGTTCSSCPHILKKKKKIPGGGVPRVHSTRGTGLHTLLKVLNLLDTQWETSC